MNNIEQLKRFIQQDEADLFSKYALGLEYIKNENFSEAEVCFKYLCNNHETYIATYYQLGKLLVQLGKTDEAKRIFRKGMQHTQRSDSKTYSELQNALTNLELGIED